MTTYSNSTKFFENGRGRALDVKETLTKSSQSPALTFELAKVLDGHADWDNKMTIQIARHELVALVRVLRGLEPELTGSYHGESRNKGFVVRANQANATSHYAPHSVMVGLNEAGKQLNIVLTPPQRTELFVIALRQVAASWKVTVSEALTLLALTLEIEGRGEPSAPSSVQD